ncbi:hypothetical protein C8R47DRAFT_1313262 [Mycena vitilis]|nr:hypothetical protein C8R47DRAFT_1313262 [Mycena vitilis]
MSDPPLLRRSGRRRGPPRHADSPVSFVPATALTEVWTVSDDGSESESDRDMHEDLLHDLETGIESEALQDASDRLQSMEPEETSYGRIPTPDIFAPGPVVSDRGGEIVGTQGVRRMLQALNASVEQDQEDFSDDEVAEDNNLLTIASVGGDQGSWQERADYIVHALNLLGAGRSSSPPALVSPVGGSPEPVTVPLGLPDGGMVTVTGIESAIAPAALYFIGIQTLLDCRQFCQLRRFADARPNDGGIFRRLALAGGPLGRALRSIIDPGSFGVGASDYPIDIAFSYDLFELYFREVATLLTVNTGYDIENQCHRTFDFLPVPPSAARTILLRSQHAPEETPVYALYIYHVGAVPLRGVIPQHLLPSAPIPLAAQNNLSQVHIPVPLIPTAIPGPLPVIAAGAPSTDITSYLLARFTRDFSDLAQWRSGSYCSAYIHCLTERQILRICQSLGIGLLGRSHTPVTVGSMTIRMEDVVITAGINSQTFSTYRTEMRLSKEAHVILRRLHRVDTLPIAYRPLLDILESMLSDRILPADTVRPAQGAHPMAEAEFTAVRMTITSLMSQVRYVVENMAGS